MKAFSLLTVAPCPLDLPCRLEYNFGKFPCVTAGETIAVTEGERRYYLDVLEAQPADAVCSIETDCAVDFAPPLDYVEPPPTVASQGNDEPPQAARFTGAAARMDGKLVEQPTSAPVPVGGQRDRTRQAAQFTGAAARMDGKPVELPTQSPAAASAGAPGVHKRKLRFGAPSAPGGGVGVSKGKEQGGGEKQEQAKRFPGTKYSLKD